MEYNQNIKEEKSIKEIINMMLRRWWILAILAVLMSASVIAYTKLTAVPKYISQGVLYVNSQKVQKTDDVELNDINASQKMVPTYMGILKSKTFLRKVGEDVNNKYSYSQIDKMIRMSSVEETNLLQIRVSCTNARDAYLICNSIISRAPEELLRVVEAGSVKLIDAAEESHEPVLPNFIKLGLLGFLVGIVIGVGIILLIELFDTRVKEASELTKRYDIPILGEVPNLEDVD